MKRYFLKNFYINKGLIYLDGVLFFDLKNIKIDDGEIYYKNTKINDNGGVIFHKIKMRYNRSVKIINNLLEISAFKTFVYNIAKQLLYYNKCLVIFTDIDCLITMARGKFPIYHINDLDYGVDSKNNDILLLLKVKDRTIKSHKKCFYLL